jgi:hypothetical protein
VGNHDATLLFKNKQNNNKAFIHNCIGNIFSVGIVGNKNPVKDNNPFMAKNTAKIIINLFIDIL